MSEVGRMFEEGEFFVPEMLVSARAMKTGLAILRPSLADANIRAIGKAVIGTVQGDLHDIGKNLIGMMLEGAGFEVIDLGVDVKPEKYVAAVQEHHPDLIGRRPSDNHHAAHAGHHSGSAGSRPADTVKVMIGGAPVTEQYARECRADFYAPDAASAAQGARKLVQA